MASWPAKDPDDILDFSLTWAEQMEIDTDTIESYEVIVEEGSVEVDDSPGHGTSFDDTTTLVWLQGGEIGETCRVVNRIVTNEGRQYDHTRTLKIKAK